MSFLSPLWLLVLIPVVALAAAYVIIQRRRQRYAVRFASLPMLDKVVPRRPGWRRHVPAAMVVTAFSLLALAAARPEMTLRVPFDRATVMVAIDVSGSMAAQDVNPSRLEAAKAAAAAFVDELPDTVNVGVVSFAGSSSVVAAPTTDHRAVENQIRSLDLRGGGTAIGESVFSSVQAIEQLAAADDAEGDVEVPARIVVLSDGTNTSGRTPEAAAQAAVDAQVPVSTIAYGTAEGVVTNERGSQPVPVDPQTLQELAAATNGTAYSAESGEELREVYADIGSSIGWRTEEREVTPYVAVVALVLGLGAAALSLRWFSRLI